MSTKNIFFPHTEDIWGESIFNGKFIMDKIINYTYLK